MPSENKETTEPELSAWKKEREKRKRERRKQRQEDNAVDEDDLALLARTLESDKYGRGIGGVDQFSNDDSDDEAPFVSLAKRKRLEKEVLVRGMAHRRRHIGINNTETDNGIAADNGNNTDTALRKNTDNDESDQVNDEDNENTTANPKKVESLLESATALQEALTEEERAEKLRNEEESRIMKEASKVQTNALQAASELAKGIQYTNPMPSTWTCPRYILDQGEESWEKIRKEWHMEVEGVDVPPPCKRFVDMKFAPPILEVLKRKGIKKPTPIQMQGLTVVRMSIEISCIDSCIIRLTICLYSCFLPCRTIIILVMLLGTRRSRFNRNCFHWIRKDADVWIAISNDSA